MSLTLIRYCSPLVIKNRFSWFGARVGPAAHSQRMVQMHRLGCGIRRQGYSEQSRRIDFGVFRVTQVSQLHKIVCFNMHLHPQYPHQQAPK